MSRLHPVAVLLDASKKAGIPVGPHPTDIGRSAGIDFLSRTMEPLLDPSASSDIYKVSDQPSLKRTNFSNAYPLVRSPSMYFPTVRGHSPIIASCTTATAGGATDHPFTTKSSTVDTKPKLPPRARNCKRKTYRDYDYGLIEAHLRARTISPNKRAEAHQPRASSEPRPLSTQIPSRSSPTECLEHLESREAQRCTCQPLTECTLSHSDSSSTTPSTAICTRCQGESWFTNNLQTSLVRTLQQAKPLLCPRMFNDMNMALLFMAYTSSNVMQTNEELPLFTESAFNNPAHPLPDFLAEYRFACTPRPLHRMPDITLRLKLLNTLIRTAQSLRDRPLITNALSSEQVQSVTCMLSLLDKHKRLTPETRFCCNLSGVVRFRRFLRNPDDPRNQRDDPRVFWARDCVPGYQDMLYIVYLVPDESKFALGSIDLMKHVVCYLDPSSSDDVDAAPDPVLMAVRATLHLLFVDSQHLFSEERAWIQRHLPILSHVSELDEYQKLLSLTRAK